MKPTATYRKLWAENLLMWSDLTLSPSSKVKRGKPNLKVLIIQRETNLYNIMDWESSDVVRLDLWHLLNDGSLALVSCLSGGYKFALILQCVGLVYCERMSIVSSVYS